MSENRKRKDKRKSKVVRSQKYDSNDGTDRRMVCQCIFDGDEDNESNKVTMVGRLQNPTPSLTQSSELELSSDSSEEEIAVSNIYPTQSYRELACKICHYKSKEKMAGSNHKNKKKYPVEWATKKRKEVRSNNQISPRIVIEGMLYTNQQNSDDSDCYLCSKSKNSNHKERKEYSSCCKQAPVQTDDCCKPCCKPIEEPERCCKECYVKPSCNPIESQTCCTRPCCKPIEPPQLCCKELTPLPRSNPCCNPVEENSCYPETKTQQVVEDTSKVFIVTDARGNITSLVFDQPKFYESKEVVKDPCVKDPCVKDPSKKIIPLQALSLKSKPDGIPRLKPKCHTNQVWGHPQPQNARQYYQHEMLTPPPPPAPAPAPPPPPPPPASVYQLVQAVDWSSCSFDDQELMRQPDQTRYQYKEQSLTQRGKLTTKETQTTDTHSSQLKTRSTVSVNEADSNASSIEPNASNTSSKTESTTDVKKPPSKKEAAKPKAADKKKKK